jgi:hypothetical protein
MSWQDKAKQLVAEHSMQAYKQANFLANGKRRARHVPYSLPEIATALIKCMNGDDEVEAKRLFVVNSLGTWSLV